VKRRRSSAPGRLRPDGRWTQILLLVSLLLALVACGQPAASEPTGPTSEVSPSDVVGPTPETTPGPPSASDAPSSTATATDEPLPTETSTTSPTPAGAGSAAACSGDDRNQDFYASMAAAVEWTVYCPVLADGWFVDDGRYRLAGGGWLEISYDGPGEARLSLRQGAFCTSDDGCVPGGQPVGQTAFGDRTGDLVATDDGAFVIVVDRGATPSWLLVVNGLDEAAARAVAGDLHAIAP
jgi:hypothetical protein